ncbi:RNA helicase [Kickxella alabastrina]|uniref:RNA helicase n=1 Tax=Kickxella alabastrina TaxID=61397 RepID=A0ACC1IH19_9FUNG|nr:RNA helicase [Kickxella alabastrina]
MNRVLADALAAGALRRTGTVPAVCHRQLHKSAACRRQAARSSDDHGNARGKHLIKQLAELQIRRAPEDAAPKRSGDSKYTRVTHPMFSEWPHDSKIDANFARVQRQLRLSWFKQNTEVRKRCANFGIDSSTFVEWSDRFAQAAGAEEIETLRAEKLVPLLIRDGREAFGDYIVNQFFAFLGDKAPHVVKNIGYLRRITDLRHPHEWAATTRKVQRRIIMHVGPTNSGKTYHALQRLQQAASGVYCSPLRLLAYEVYDRMTRAGISCSLMTGEDRRLADFSVPELNPIGMSINGEPVTQIDSCTIEMAPNKPYNVAVIDEIQMIADRQRGWAWTNALLNIPAAEIHLCGEASAVPIVKQICASLDEEVEVREYTRLGALHTSNKALQGDWSKVRRGDCIVSFSRKGIYDIKSTIESKTGLRCAIIYGGLPPEARVEQARLFNDPNSGYDVLVASDAIGMGINLSIKRVIFVELSKFDGGSMRPISVSQTRQIGGRAGRFGSGAEAGEVTTMESKDLKHLALSMEKQPPALAAVGIKPTTEAIETFSHQFPGVPFSQLWPMFRDVATVSPGYFLCSFHEQEKIATLVEHLPLSVRDRYQFIYAPINTRSPIVCSCLAKYAAAVAHGTECLVGQVVKLPPKLPTNRIQLEVFEQWHRAITLFMWLSFHFPETYIELDEAMALKTDCERMITEGLATIRSHKKAEGLPPKAAPGAKDTVEAAGKAETKARIREMLGIKA